MFDFDQSSELQEQSSFQKLYNQKKRDLQLNSKSLAQELLNLEDQSLYSLFKDEDEESQQDFSSQYDLVARILNIPHTQVYYQATTNPVAFSKMIEKARRQIRRQKAKSKNKNKRQPQNESSTNSVKDVKIVSTTQSSSNDEEILTKKQKSSEGQCKRKKVEKVDIPNLDGELSKRQIQMIRNRISAQNSRDRKKLYMQSLEEEQSKITQVNSKLLSKVEQLEQQLQASENSRAQLQVQLDDLRSKNDQYMSNLICMDCKGRSIVHEIEYYESKPNILSHRSSGISNLGFAFFTVFAIIAFVGYVPAISNTNSNETQTSVVEKGRFLQDSMYPTLKNNTCRKSDQPMYYERRLNVGDDEYDIFHKIHELRESNSYKYLVKYGLVNPDNIIKYLPEDEPFVQKMIKEKKNPVPTKKATQIATLDYFDQENRVSTLYCPNSYKYQDFSQPEGIKVTFENSQWIQLMVPRKNITLFYENWLDKQIMIREGVNDTHIQNNKSQITEVWCQVKSVTDIMMD